MRQDGKEGEGVGETEAERSRERAGECGCVREIERGRERESKRHGDVLWCLQKNGQWVTMCNRIQMKSVCSERLFNT